jgi:hypothetical protein
MCVGNESNEGKERRHRGKMRKKKAGTSEENEEGSQIKAVLGGFPAQPCQVKVLKQNNNNKIV